MANSYSWGGAVNTTSMFTSDLPYIYTPGIGMPTGTVAANGNAPIRVESVSLAYVTNGYASINYQGSGSTGGTTWGTSGGSFTVYANRTGGSMNVGRNNASGGTTYWSDGDSLAGQMPGSLSWSTVPTAPTIGTVTQTSPVSATLTWGAPGSDGGSAITGYRILYATNSGFTGATTLDVGNVLTRSVTGLTPGAQVYFKVAALNTPATTASTSSVFSGSVNVVLVADIGDLDGWASYGTLPSGLTPIVTGALRRGSVYPVAGKTGLLREVQQTGSGGPVTTQTLGIQRLISGLKIGTAYKLTANMVALQDTTPTGNEYAFFVAGTGTGTSAATSNTSSPVAIPEYNFTAFDTSQVMGITLKETTSWSGAGWWEAVGFYDFKLWEVPPTSPYKLQDVAYEGSLANHFSYACNTVDAAWWVDRSDVTQFRQADSQDTLKATFTDKRATGKREYVGIKTSYATRDVVNTISVTNHGRDAATGKTLDYSYVTADPTSATAWGVRSGSTDWTLYTPNLATNLMLNPRAGTGLTYWNPYSSWSATSRVATGGPTADIPTFVRTTATAAAASNGGGIYYTEGGNTVAASTTYTMSGWIRASTATTWNWLMQPYNGGTSIGGTLGSTPLAVAANVWTFMTMTIAVPAGATSLRVHLTPSSGAASGTILDATGYRLSVGTNADTAYFDGSTPDTAYWDFGWNGVAHASTSTKSSLNVQARTAEVLAKYSTPQKTITSIRWNAAEDPTLGATLDIQDRIRVEYNGQVQDSRITGIKHDLTGDRWMVELTLVKS